MAAVTVDENELRALRGAHNLLDGLMKDPKLRPYTEKLIKAKHPSVVTSEDNPYVKEMRSAIGELKELKTSLESKEIQQKLDAAYDELRNKRRYTDEGIEKIQKLMVERNIPDPIDAADVWEKRNPPKVQEPSGYEPDSWNLNSATDDEDLKLLWKDEDAWANREIKRAFNDFRKNSDE